MSLNEFEQLLDRYYYGKCTPAEQAWIEKWLGDTMPNATGSWQRLSVGEKQAFVDRLYADIAQKTSDRQTGANTLVSHSRRAWWWAGGVAASICLAILTYVAVQQRDPGAAPIVWKTLVSEPGQRKQFQLADGTTVWLQGGSELRYPAGFSGGRRIVQLDGEAFFDVFRNPENPFIVQAGQLETEVLGTTFNVAAFSELDKKVVSLIEGKVAVRVRDSTGVQGNAIVLAPGEAAVFREADVLLSKHELPVFDSPEDFKAGNLQFEDTPVEEVLFRLSTAYGVEVVYDREKAKLHRITANFTIAEPVDDVFRSLARSTGAQYRREDRSVAFDF